jgi:UDP-glucose 4-epimerase
MLKILILGGNGFIGKNLIFDLINKNYYLRIFDKYNTFEGLNSEKIEFNLGDFDNLDLLKKSLNGIDIVVHLLSTTNPAISNKDPQRDIKSNLLNTLDFLDLMCEEGVKRIIFASTGGAIYGETVDSEIDELHQTNPISSYGIVKLAIEKYLEIYRRLWKLEYTILRFSNPYGVYQNPLSGQGAIAAFIWKVLNKESIEIWGDGEVARDFIYISDVVDAIAKAIEFQPKSRIYNIGSGEKIKINKIISLIEVHAQYKVKVNHLAARDVDVRSNCLDINLAKKELNWHPTVNINDGIARLFDHYQKMKLK